MSQVPDYRTLRERAARAERAQFGRGSLIVCDNLVKIYKVADLEVVALQGFDLLVDSGDLVAVVGASGSGKSTLMNILAGLDTPSAGRALVAGNDLLAMSDRDRLHYRRRVVGFVWQQTGRNLLPYLSAAENVELPMILAGTAGRWRRRRTLELLDVVGLADRTGHRPDRLSGGEQQRVAIATALANEPRVLLADEPTGELDTASSNQVFAVFRKISDELGVAVIVATHDPLVSTQTHRTVANRDGRASSETLRHPELSAAGERRLVAEEFVVMDRAGRLQLPADYVVELGMERRVRVRLESDHVGVWPDRPKPEAPPAEPES
jgi:ABC-type lipoprotein export system ATPase subunit